MNTATINTVAINTVKKNTWAQGRKAIVLSTLSLGLVMSAQSQAAVQAPDAFVKTVADALITKLKTQRAAYKKDPKVLTTIVQQNIEPYVDFEGFSRGVMGKYYRVATDAQKVKFTQTFHDSLLRTYSNSLAAYDNESYSIRPYVAGNNPEKANVTMDFKTDSGTVIPVTYQMVQIGNSWKMRNVQLNGIDVGQTFNKQFSDTVQKNRGNLDAAIVSFLPAPSK